MAACRFHSWPWGNIRLEYERIAEAARLFQADWHCFAVAGLVRDKKHVLAAGTEHSVRRLQTRERL